MRPIKYLILFIFLISSISYSQPDIAYIIPDIGTPGMNTYFEIIAPYNAKGTFGADGLYLNNPTDNVKIELINSADAEKISFGPIVISWDGRMISTQAFIHPDVIPNTWDWQTLDPEFIIDFRVIVNGQPSNQVSFYIVTPFPFGDRTASPETVIGQGSLGKRSPSGAMIVDSMILADQVYTISRQDILGALDQGNRGYLPMVLLSKGKIIGIDNTAISVTSFGKHGGPGGGGGGGSTRDWSGDGQSGGDGYTGGGPGGRNRSGNPLSSDWHNNPGVGSGDYFDQYSGGKSLNDVRGGWVYSWAYESAGGGTGHPFGVSGEGGCGVGCDPPGKQGGGSGFTQNKSGGSAGYATDGQGESNTYGKAHGNDMVVPLAGGSGGASGNPQFPLFSGGGNGGGGGGALAIFGIQIEQLLFDAHGGSGLQGPDPDVAHGGGGSGGYIGVSSKLPIDNITMEANGGSGSDGSKGFEGGSGRFRYDSPMPGNIFMQPDDASRFVGLTSDTNMFVPRTFRLYGSKQNSTKIVHGYLKSESGIWEELTNLTNNRSSWDVQITLTGNDSLYFFVAMEEVSNPNQGDYDAEPSYVLSQAAANIFILDDVPIINCDTLRKIQATNCPGDIYSDTVWVRNFGGRELICEFDKAAFKDGTKGFTLITPTTQTIVPAYDSVRIIINWAYQAGQSGTVSDVLTFPHNDLKAIKKPWEIRWEVKIDSIYYESYTIEDGIKLGILDLGQVCPDTEVERDFILVNHSEIEIDLLDPELKLQTSFFQVSNLRAKKLAPGDSTLFNVQFLGSPTTGSYVTIIYLKNEQCPEIIDSVRVTVRVVESDLQFTWNTNFPDTKVGENSQITISLVNNGSTSAYIKEVLPLSPPFTIININPPVPPERFLSPGGKIDITVRFTPTDAMPFISNFEIGAVSVDTACADTAETSLTGLGIKASVIVSTDSLWYGIEPWCGEKQDSVIVRNAGQADFTITDTLITGIDAANFSIAQSPLIPYVLQPGDSAVFHIRFRAEFGPQGDKIAELVISTDDIDDPEIRIKLAGFKDELNILAVPDTLYLGQIPIGETASGIVNLTNNGIIYRDINNYKSTNSNISVTPDGYYLDGSGGTYDFEISKYIDTQGIQTDSVWFMIEDPCPDSVLVIVVSDGLKAYAFVTDSLKLGELAFCETGQDSILVQSTGDAYIIVNNLTIEGADAGLFALDPFDVPDTLQPTKYKYYVINFDPSSAPDGFKEARVNVELFMNGAIENYYTNLTGSKQSVIADYPQPLDFGSVTLNISYSDKLRLTNTGDLPLTVNNMTLPTLTGIFDIQPQTVNTVLNKDDFVEFDVTFTPLLLQSYLDSVRFDLSLNSCDDFLWVKLKGEGTPGDSIALWFPKDTIVDPMERDQQIPIYYQLYTNKPVEVFPTLNITMSLNASMYYPLSLSGGAILNNDIVSGDRLIELELKNIDFSRESGILTYINGSALLGETDYTDIIFESVEWSGFPTLYKTNLTDGSMITAICDKGGKRLLKNNDPLSLMISPNPVGDKADIDISALETGKYKLEIIDITGKRKILNEWNVSGSKKFLMSIDLREFSSGVYNLLLSSPNRFVSEIFYIYK